MTIEELTAAVGYLVARYLHIVCTALLVGGTLFYEMVVPVAVGDMSEGQQLAVMGRSRWVFRWIVWLSGTVLLITGIATTVRHWHNYTDPIQDEQTITVTDASTTQPSPAMVMKLRSGWWWVAHMSTGCIAVLVAFSLTMGRTPPAHPIQWMRLNLVILLIVIFLGSVTREIRLSIDERQESSAAAHSYYIPDSTPIDAHD